MIPDWLQKKEEYVVISDRDAFIERSILAFLRLLSRFRLPAVRTEKRAGINARVGLVSTVLLILLLSLSRDVPFLGYAGALLLAILSFQQGALILRILKMSIPIAMFTFLVMLPSAFGGNAAGVIVISLKVFFSVIAMRLFVESEGWESTLSALRVFFLPRLFILVLDITSRYLVLLGEHSLQMLYALKLRSVGRNALKTVSLGGIAGTLFLKSRQMAEDTYAAMECRCFTGSYSARRGAGLSAVDLIPLALGAVTVFVFLAVRMT